MKTMIILGSSRRQGNTAKFSEELSRKINADIYYLEDFEISFFDYKQKNINDGFAKLYDNIMNHDHIVFATPVYWYTMSAQMKVFFDRLSDLLTSEKERGRLLRGKSCSVLATGSDLEPPSCFLQPFKLTASYLGINFKYFTYLSVEHGFDSEKACEKLVCYWPP